MKISFSGKAKDLMEHLREIRDLQELRKPKTTTFVAKLKGFGCDDTFDVYGEISSN